MSFSFSMSSMIEDTDDDVWYTDTEGLKFGISNREYYCYPPYKSSEMEYVRTEYNNLHASKNTFRHSYINVTSNKDPVKTATPERTEDIDLERFINTEGVKGRENTRNRRIDSKEHAKRNIWIGITCHKNFDSLKSAHGH